MAPKAMKAMKAHAQPRRGPPGTWLRCKTDGSLKEIQIRYKKGKGISRITAFWGGKWWAARINLKAKKQVQWKALKHAKWMDKLDNLQAMRRPAAAPRVG